MVVHQHFFRYAAEVLQAADDPFVSVLGIQASGAPEVEAPRITQLVDDEPTLTDFPPTPVTISPQSLCICCPGRVSHRTVDRLERITRFGWMYLRTRLISPSYPSV